MKPAPRRLTPILGSLALLFALAFVFVAVLERRFAGGDIYPHYSTARSDPLGASAIFESLAALPGYEVSRNQRSLMMLDTLDEHSALWLCGLSQPAFAGLRAPGDSPIVKAIEEKGARLIVTVNPQSVPKEHDATQSEEIDDWLDRREEARRRLREEKQKKTDAGEPGEEKKAEAAEAEKEAGPGKGGQGSEGKKKDEADDENEEAELEKAFGPKFSELFGVELETPQEGKFERPEAGWELSRGDGIEAARPVPGALPAWRSHLYFGSLADDWRVAARVEGRPVLIERRLGKGSIVLASDSYFASNEALWRGASPELLLWLGGGKTRHVFDETIHGSEESGGAMKMILRYRLHGFFLGFFLFVALLAWRSGSSLAPGSEALERGLVSGDGAAIAGEETASGFVGLLRRGVPGKRLLQVCLDTWRQTAGRRWRGETAGQREAVESLIRRHEASPGDLPAPEAYRRIARVLAHPDEHRAKAEGPQKPA